MNETIHAFADDRSLAELLLRKLNEETPDPEIRDTLDALDAERTTHTLEIAGIQTTEDARRALQQVSNLMLAGTINARQASLLLYAIQQQLAVIKLEYGMSSPPPPPPKPAPGFTPPQNAKKRSPRKQVSQ